MTLSRRDLLASAVTAACVPKLAATPRNIALYGSEDSPADALALRAGPVTAVFEPGTGFLRYVAYGDKEIVRGIYAAVRDRVWGTVAPRITNVVVEDRGMSFKLTFDVDCKQGDIDFFWQGVITGSAEGRVRFEMNGKARSTFRKNRLGFAILHPIKECAGQPCQIEKTDGSTEQGTFPAAISPHQPFLDLRAITHTVEPGLTAEVRMEGETFEMEDHRNWTDGNYKTYCTPLALPYPVEVKEGAEIRQSVTITLKGNAVARRYRRATDVELKANPGRKSKLPALGTCLHAATPDPALWRLLRASHVRVDLRLWEQNWPSALTAAAALGVPLEAAVFVTDRAEEELPRLAAAVRGVRIARWLVFHQKEDSTKPQWLRLARRLLPGGAPLGGGSNVFFTELNRERPPVETLDVACYPINPQVHAFDNLSLVENLEPQAETVRSALRFLPSKAIAVTPVTLRPRFNPQAGGPSGAPAESRIDPRQKSLFGAAWTVGSLKYLSEAGAASVTYYETAGPAGLTEGARAFPLYHVLADATDFAGAEVTAIDSADPLRVCALSMERRGVRRMLVANLTADVQVARLWDGWMGRQVQIRRLDEHSFEHAGNSPIPYRRATTEQLDFPSGRLEIPLLPYSVIRLDA